MPSAIITDKTELRKALRAVTGTSKGQNKFQFTLADLAEAESVSDVTARKHIAQMIEAGSVERVSTGESNGRRGRPAHLFAVTKGKGSTV